MYRISHENSPALKENMPQPFPTSFLVIFAMHRSGSSALTRSINLCGYALPKTLIEATKFNETGHWESKPIARFNDAIMNEIGIEWRDFKTRSQTLTDDRKTSLHRELVDLLSTEFSTTEPAVLKEPRICRLAELYLGAFKAKKIKRNAVILFRNPLEVIHSLKRRNGLVESHAGLLWLRYICDAVLATGRENRLFLSYDAFMTAPIASLERIETDLKLSFPKPPSSQKEEIETFLNPSHRHFQFQATDLSTNPVTQNLLGSVYDALRVLENDPRDRKALAAIKSANDNLNAMESIFVAITEEHATAQSSLEQSVTEKDLKISALAIQVEKLKLAAETRKTQLELARQSFEADKLSSVSLDDRPPQTFKGRDDMEQQIKSLENALDIARNDILNYKQSTSWRMTAPIRFGRNLLKRFTGR